MCNSDTGLIPYHCESRFKFSYGYFPLADKCI